MKKKEDTSGIHLWVVLWKAYESVSEHAQRHLATLCLGFSDFAVLEVLLHKGPMAVNTLGGKINLTSGSISIAIDRLEKKGLVERRNDPEDRRARMVHLTPHGCEVIEAAFEDHAAAMERAASGLSETERAQAVALLKKLGKSAQSSVPE